MRRPPLNLCRGALWAALFLTLSVPATAQLGNGHAKFLGNVYASSQLPGFEQTWNQVTPENAGKWGSVERQRDQMNWETLDAAVALARAEGFPVRFHVLIWGNQQPSWIETLDPIDQLAEIEEWFAAVAARYPDLEYVEVVNEPLHDPPNQAGQGGGNYLAALGGTGATGWDWVVNAFKLARAHFPNAKLMINEFGILDSSTNLKRYLSIINLLKADDLIDGVGVQAHAFTTSSASADSMTSTLDRLGETGLPIQITELDIDGVSDAAQLQEYMRVFPSLWGHPSVEGITLWGWRPGMWRTQEQAFLVNAAEEHRPALQWLSDFLALELDHVAPRR